MYSAVVATTECVNMRCVIRVIITKHIFVPFISGFFFSFSEICVSL